MLKLKVLSAVAVLLVANFAQAASFTIQVKGVTVSQGNILLSVFNDAEAFPKDAAKAVYKIKVPATQGLTVITINNVVAGEYAVAVVHDENSNDEMDKNGLGLPKEDFGFSRDAMGTFGPPSFKKAKVPVADPATVIDINLKSM